MLLRCQCRALLSRPSLNRTPHIKHYPAYRGKRIDPFNFSKPSTRQERYQEPDAEESNDEDYDDDISIEERRIIEARLKKAEAREKQQKEEKEKMKERGKGLEAVDASMSNKDLGLYSGPRKRKRQFIRWMVTSGSKHEFYPQAIAMDIESRRVERLRKRSEERMFKKMNDFFNSLSEEEITEGTLIKPPKIGGKIKKRPIYPHPSPFQQLMGGLPPGWEETSETESVVLKLLSRSNKSLHKQYEEYINWSDYKLQKQRLYFLFPTDFESPGFRDVLLRFLAIDEQAEKEEEERDKENVIEPKGEDDGEVKIPDPEALDELLRLERIAKGEAEKSEIKTQEHESPVETSDSAEPASEATVETTSSETESAPVDNVETSESNQLSKEEKEKEKKEAIDLAYHAGPRLPLDSRFVTIPIYKHHYVNPTGDPTPFLMNPTFKPWRPIPHSTRLKMFDAWRAGLGLRNVSWLGGVGWRRVDGIIGILKREWEFVEKGGKLENAMAEYMDALLAKTPVIGRPSYNVPRASLVCLAEEEEEDDSEHGIDSENAIEDKSRPLWSEINAAERDIEGEGVNPEATIAGTDVDVEGEQPNRAENMEEAEEFDDNGMEEEDLEVDEEMVERLEGLQHQIAEEGLDGEGIRRLIADEKLDERTIRHLLADEHLDRDAIRQLIDHAKLVETTMRSRDPSQPVILVPQYRPTLAGIDLNDPTEKDIDLISYKSHFETLNKIHAIDREWETSNKEPLVEIPIRRTAQYWAFIQEMEEYSEKRAAHALEGLDGHTLTEKEEGIKKFEQYFGGLRSLRGREKFQGTPPWEKRISGLERKQRHLRAERLARNKPGQKYLPEKIKTTRPTALSPAEQFRLATSTDLSAAPTFVTLPKERVVWRFEDVSWVKQRTIRPRKVSFVGTLDKRVQLESGVERYGPFGIGSGTIEGVGGVKHVLERGLDGHLRMGKLPKEKERVRRERVV